MADQQLPLLPLILDEGVPAGLRQALMQEGIPADQRRPGPPQGRLLLVDSRSGRWQGPAAGQVAIDVDPLRDGFGRDPFQALLDQQSGRFAWQIGPLVLSEQVARVDKRAVRRRLMERLRGRVEQAGGIWLRLCPFPFPYHSAFSFRIDYDQYDCHDFHATLQAIAGYEGATSHFVCGAAYEGAMEALVRLRGLDVGSHGYRHRVYLTRRQNVRNIARAIDVLEQAGIEPSGFVAPCGQFHRRLVEALESLGITHSSDFGLAYDELPFFLPGSPLLQIPVHPVCLGLFLEAARRSFPPGADASAVAAGRAAEQAVAYFDQLVRLRYYSGEPVLIYGHPTGRLGRYPCVVRQVLGVAGELCGLWKTNFSELARWWRARAEVQLTVLACQGQYVVLAKGMPRGYRLAVEYWCSQHVALVPLDGPVVRFCPSALGYQTRRKASSLEPVRIDPPQPLARRMGRLLRRQRAWLARASASRWHHWVKHTIRHPGDG